jgi:hypothetical protein
MKTPIKYIFLAYAVRILAEPLNKPERSEKSIELDATPKQTPSSSGMESIQDKIEKFVESDLIKGTLESTAKGQVEDVVLKDTSEVIDYMSDTIISSLPSAFKTVKNNALEIGLASVVAGYTARYLGFIE